MLNRIPDSLNRCEGGLIRTVLSPAAYFIAQQNYALENLTGLLFADTSVENWLDRIVKDFGMSRNPATKAIRRIDAVDRDENPLSLPVGSLWMIDQLTFEVIAENPDGGCRARCEQEGEQGNALGGELIALDYIKGLKSAVLSSKPLIPAQNMETDESLRTRFYASVRHSPFGGNIADYEQKTLSIPGVGAVKVFPASALNPPQAGIVGIMIGDAQGKAATEELISNVQKEMGIDGGGLAPVGHTVKVKTPSYLLVDITAKLTIKTGVSTATAKAETEACIREYILSIGFHDPIIYYAKLSAEILNTVSSVIDINNLTLNGDSKNLVLEKTFETFQLPELGTVILTG